MTDSVDGYITKTKQGQTHYDMLMLLYRPNLSVTLIYLISLISKLTLDKKYVALQNAERKHSPGPEKSF